MHVLPPAAPASLATIPASDVLRFWQSLHLSKFDVGAQTLVLPAGVTWLGEINSGRNMLVRSCYTELRDVLVEEHFAAVLGTPGIGKSWFGLFMAWQHTQSKPSMPLIYQAQTGKLVYLKDHGVEFVDYRAVEPFLDTAGAAVYIVDGGEPRPSVCKTLLISSPKKDVWSKWQVQRVARVFYMPAFLLSELELCRSLCFPAVTYSRLELLFERWGGSVRLTLSHAAAAAQIVAMSQLSSDLTSKDLGKMLEVVAAADSAGLEDASHRVIHIIASLDYTQFTLAFASRYMCNRALAASVIHQKGKVIAFIQAADGVAMLGSIRGSLYEQFAVAALRAGGTFKLQPLVVSGALTDAAPQDVTFPPRDVSYFSQDRDLPDVCSTLSLTLPAALNFPTWDAVVLEPDKCLVTFFQMTVSTPRTHGLKVAGFLRAGPLVSSFQRSLSESALPESKVESGSRPRGTVETRFIWVCPRVPPSLSPVTIASSSSRRPPHWLDGMRQFVLVVPSSTMESIEDTVATVALADASAVDDDLTAEPRDSGAASSFPVGGETVKRQRLTLSLWASSGAGDGVRVDDAEDD